MCTFLRLIAFFIIAAATALQSAALPADHFAKHSRLATGRWIKVSVTESGPCLITNSILKSNGFSNINAVRVFGYPGSRPDDELSPENFTDDLPPVPSIVTPAGVVFYAGAPAKIRRQDGVYRYITNVYSNYSYYYITESDQPAPQWPQTGIRADKGANTAYNLVHHEKDLEAPGEAGAHFVGENFSTYTSHSFKMPTPGAVADSSAMLTCSFVSRVTSGMSTLIINGTGINADINVDAAINDSKYFGSESLTINPIKVTADQTDLQLIFKSAQPGAPAWLNYLTLLYKRRLKLDKGFMTFFSAQPELSIESANASQLVVWDITDPTHILTLPDCANGNTFTWKATEPGTRHYVAYVKGSECNAPAGVTTVANQDLHDLGPADMIIYTYPQWADQARRLAKLHAGAPDSLTTHVIDINLVYNEFGSGAPNVNALRRLNKMIYDRGAGTAHSLKYVLLMGSATFDERHLLQATRSKRYYSIPSWQTLDMVQTLSWSAGYGTDDYIAMLDDDQTGDIGSAQMSVAVGRMCVNSREDARIAVDKVEKYINESKRSTWRNRVLLVSDDGNMGVHSIQCENFETAMRNQPDENFLVNKMYTDAYDYNSNIPTAGRNEMFRLLREGVLMWVYVGHGNPSRWSDNDILVTSDIANFYAPQAPILYAATCDFLRWDSNTVSGAEIMYFKPYGGLAAVISATRPVNIADNEYMTNAMGRSMTRRDSLGRHYPIGEVYRWAKNNLFMYDTNQRERPVKVNYNRRRYVLLGDPALRMPLPDLTIQVDSLNGVPINQLEAPQIKARQLCRISGSIINPATNTTVSDFSGSINYDLYDATESRTTKDHAREDKTVTFDIPGQRLASGGGKVRNGRFSLTVAMPEQTSQNWRTASLNMLAVNDNAAGQTASIGDAAGLIRNIYVYDTDTGVEQDTVAPEIKLLALNHENYVQGAVVHSTPTLLAHVTDDRGINLSLRGVGRQMTATLDRRTSYSDLALYFTPLADGEPGGTLAYPLPALTDGPHSLELRVWDTDGNCATRTIDFVVDGGLQPKIIDVTTDANPAVEQANFFITHDQPETVLSLTLSIYSLDGRLVWSETRSGRSDGNQLAPISWPLTDGTGRRVARGIYLYRVQLATKGGSEYSTSAKKIAVAPQ